MAEESAPVDAALSAFAGDHWGVFGPSQARSLGLSAGMASDRVAAGRLWRLHQGVYSIVPPPLLRLEGRWLAAVFACGPGAVLSHTEAAAIWELRHAHAGPIHVTVPTRSGRRRRHGITIHRSGTLLPSDVTVRRGVRVTQPARTLADLRPLIPASDWERTCSRALDRHLHLGILGDGAIPTFSVLEDRLKRLCRRHSLPSPRAQQQLGPFTVDFLWPEHRVVVECDDFATHGRRETFESDRERDAWLQLQGYRVLRFTWRQVEDHPGRVVATLRAALR